MKKLFTLSIAIFCALALNAQVSESGNGFLEMFDYPDSTVYDSSIAYEGIEAEWGDFSMVIDGKLSWELPDSNESAIGLWELSMDLSENTDIKFKYQFPEGAEFGIWVEDTLGGGGELFPEDFMLGLGYLMSYTFDLTGPEFSEVDLSAVAEIWIMSYTDKVGTFYLDDLVIGDGWSVTGTSGKIVESSLQVYPNPASDVFRIDSDIKSLSIYNTIGQIVFSMADYQRGSSVDISYLDKGIYIIKADESTHKLLKK